MRGAKTDFPLGLRLWAITGRRLGGAAAGVLALSGCSAGEDGEALRSGTYEQIVVALQAEAYSAQSGTQLERTSDAGGGQNVGWIDGGDWLGYDFSVGEAGTYQVSYRVASRSAGGRFLLQSNDGSATYGSIDVPVTGAWQAWTTISHEVHLPAGTAGLRLAVLRGGFNVNWFEIASKDSSSVPPNEIEAEDFEASSSPAPFLQVSDAGRTFLEWPGDGALFTAPSDEAAGQLHYTFTAGQAPVELFATVSMPHAGSDSFFYKVDGVTGWETQNHMQTTGFEELEFASLPNVVPGQTYRLRILRREDGTKLDKFRIEGGTFGEASSGPLCGNAIVEADGSEQCDDGNSVDGDGCSSTCIAEIGFFCGDGVVAPGEECDDGNSLSGDGCAANCTVESGFVCSNAIVEADGSEQCDDGNSVDGDGCSSICVVEVGFVCGDAVVAPGEECDDGNNLDGDGCSSTCIAEIGFFCGDGVVAPGEECDDGNSLSGDGCAANCTVESGFVCSNAIVEADGSEQCDDGNSVDGDGCSSICVVEVGFVCGDAVVAPGEECDDGNNLDGDGCSSTCIAEIGFFCGDGVVAPGEECDDGNSLSGDGCAANCTVEAGFVCSNAIVDAGGSEQCDDGNSVDGDGCSSICVVEVGFVCGDAVVAPGEQCDDGNNLAGDGCSSNCRVETRF